MPGDLDTVDAVLCPACNERGVHEKILLCEGVHHLRCRACMSVNAFRLGKNVDSQGRSRLRPYTATPVGYDELVEQHKDRVTKEYKSTDSFSAGDLIEHHEFGKGYVLSVHSPPIKMVVLFSDRRHVLLCKGAHDDSSTEADDADLEEHIKCPICGAEVRRRDLWQFVDGRIIGCARCR